MDNLCTIVAFYCEHKIALNKITTLNFLSLTFSQIYILGYQTKKNPLEEQIYLSTNPSAEYRSLVIMAVRIL